MRSVHAGTSASIPSLARMSVPEHCAPMSWRVGSKLRADMILESFTISRVLMPLPTITASAEGISARVDCPSTVTPFIEVTDFFGQQSVTRQSGFLIRLSTPSATRESSSLKPWKVSMAMCILVTSVSGYDA